MPCGVDYHYLVTEGKDKNKSRNLQEISGKSLFLCIIFINNDREASL